MKAKPKHPPRKFFTLWGRTSFWWLERWRFRGKDFLLCLCLASLDSSLKGRTTCKERSQVREMAPTCSAPQTSSDHIKSSYVEAPAGEFKRRVIISPPGQIWKAEISDCVRRVLFPVGGCCIHLLVLACRTCMAVLVGWVAALCFCLPALADGLKENRSNKQLLIPLWFLAAAGKASSSLLRFCTFRSTLHILASIWISWFLMALIGCSSSLWSGLISRVSRSFLARWT